MSAPIIPEEGYCAFDLLLRSNVIHIWEKIFLSLDYQSYKSCQQVCMSWSQVLCTDSFWAKARITFSAEIWMDTENLDREAWRSSKEITIWTASNEEVAFVENVSRKSAGITENHYHILHFIDHDGKLSSRRIRGVCVENEDEDDEMEEEECLFEHTEIWILRHYILLINDGNQLMGFDRRDLGQFVLGKEPEDSVLLSTHLNPGIWIRFLFQYPGKLQLQEVQFHYLVGERLEAEAVDMSEGNFDEDNQKFSEDGSHFLHCSSTGMQAYDIYKNGENELMMRHLWSSQEITTATLISAKDWRANSKFIFYIGKQSSSPVFCLYLTNIKDGTILSSYEIGTHTLKNSDFRLWNRSIALTEQRIFVFLSYLHGRKKKDKLFMLDPNTTGYKSVIKSDSDLDFCPTELPGGVKEIPMNTFCNGRVGVYHQNYDRKIEMFDLTLGDPGKILDGRKKIGSGRVLRNFSEIRMGVSIFQSNEQFLPGKKSRIELMAWKGVKLSKAFGTFSDLLTQTDLMVPIMDHGDE